VFPAERWYLLGDRNKFGCCSSSSAPSRCRSARRARLGRVGRWVGIVTAPRTHRQFSSCRPASWQLSLFAGDILVIYRPVRVRRPRRGRAEPACPPSLGPLVGLRGHRAVSAARSRDERRGRSEARTGGPGRAPGREWRFNARRLSVGPGRGSPLARRRASTASPRRFPRRALLSVGASTASLRWDGGASRSSTGGTARRSSECCLAIGTAVGIARSSPRPPRLALAWAIRDRGRGLTDGRRPAQSWRRRTGGRQRADLVARH